MPLGNEGKKEWTSSCMDRISALPDDLIQRILGLLPADEAVRTCVLAARWRHLWKSTPVLRVTNPKRWTNGWEFNNFVSQLLLFRDPSPLEECEFVSYPYNSQIGRPTPTRPPESHRHVDVWIRWALLRKARALRVCVLGGNFCVLSRLVLASPHLTRLELSGVKIINTDFLDLSRCPSLQELKLDACYLHSVHEFSSLSLKRLSFSLCEFSQFWRTRVYAPCLVYLLLDVNEGRTPILEDMPSLEAAFVRLNVCRTTVPTHMSAGSVIPSTATAAIEREMAQAASF